ncbi:DUF397 domain-containing protein [Pseudonocardia sp. HH130630-07]|uniref:DUF397 domain-containing protein n=1 Tax=Pseudonocardia sp. HH130630-07 TaxID=1690815 RepID=UPI000814DC5A|nr:DUF397 domain-containing protein [Pseudonocardia sp. HH130630-07]ANY07426.1 DUF397 domain-containing protein [Pseudonocardia sp. HH130630-07]
MPHDDIVAALSASTTWHKSTHSGGENGGCVEVATIPGHAGVRDTKLGTASPVLAFTTAEWRAFLTGVAHGEFPAG